MVALGVGDAWLVEEISLWRGTSELFGVMLRDVLKTLREWNPIFLRLRLWIGVDLETLHSLSTPPLESDWNNKIYTHYTVCCKLNESLK